MFLRIWISPFLHIWFFPFVIYGLFLDTVVNLSIGIFLLLLTVFTRAINSADFFAINHHSSALHLLELVT
jgi:hypothetical protein